MMIAMKKKLLIAMLCYFVLPKSYSQSLAMGPMHFDHTYTQADPSTASYKGYFEKLTDGFVTTIYAAPSVKIAKLTFADKALTRRHGQITSYHKNGDVMFAGNYKNNRLNGTWISWYGNLATCDSGSLKNNIPDGEWKTWYADGNLRSVRTFDAYRYHSLMSEIQRNNPRLSFFYLTRLAKKNKNQIDLHTNAIYSYTTLANDSRTPQPNASLKELAEINTDVDTDYYHPPFPKGLHHGLYMNFYPDGGVKDSGYYKNGLRDGVWEEWLENGTVRSTGFYQHGLKKNSWKFFNASGRLLYYQHYDRNGKADHAKEFAE